MASETPEITVVTALYNRLDLTRGFLDDLSRTLAGFRYEVILVDDGSTDGTREFLSELDRPEVRTLFNEKNLGFAGSNNLGASVARAPILAFLNNDLVLREGWFEPMRRALTAQTGFVGNVQINAQSRLIDHAGIVFSPWGIPEHWGQGYLRVPSVGERVFRAVTAACCLIDRHTFQSAGGFDSSYRNGFEDIDLCLRLNESGKTHSVAFASRVGHWVSASPGRKDGDADNIKRFLGRWGAQTSRWGLKDWPAHYLRRHYRRPWRLNGRKTLDALRLVSGWQKEPSGWMKRRAESLRNKGVPDE